MVLFKKGITAVLIRLRGCAGWSAPMLFATPKDRFSQDGAHILTSLNDELKAIKCICTL